MRTRSDVNPPRWFRYALPLVLRRSSRECFIGDLVEELDEISRARNEVPKPGFWYARQLVYVISSGRLTLLLASMGCIAILVTNAFLPLVGIRVPEFAAINVVCFGGAALVWVFAGFIAYQRSGVVTDGLRAGASISLVTMITAMMTFALVRRDGAPLAPLAFLPMFALVGATCGVLGSALARFATPIRETR